MKSAEIIGPPYPDTTPTERSDAVALRSQINEVSVLEDLHVEKIDLGKTFPVILKVEPMQWNAKGIWFNLFFFYRDSLKITIKTRLVLQPLLNYNPDYDQPIHTLLTKLATNKHFQRFAALKPVVGVIEKLSNAELGANVELTSFSGIMTINIPAPPNDRIWIDFHSYSLIHDFLEASIRDELKRMAVLPCMDDQLLSFFRDWVIDAIAEIASKPGNPLIDSYKS
ncbi:unnamed protein product [Rotaria magnacalcarata]|uniref:Uncharacterized protein n=1 Tax=Rotaria magnacalcarata TaxID=392030 RepID=A0A814L7U7_9BILA|nr:unnamed protein product [Rotaria magnacalcarata]